MRRRSTVCSLFILGWLIVLATPAFASDPPWVEVRSPHFSVVTDAGEKRGRDVALHFEQMRAAFGAFMNKAKVSVPIPLQIVAFRNTKEMRQYSPLWKGKPVELAGLFQGDNDRTYILLDMSAQDPWQVVFHEYAHQLLNGNSGSDVQPWFDEGFAEFFSTIEASGKTAALGKASQNTFNVLQQNKLMPVSVLFQVQHNSGTYNESGDHRSLFYAESWLVVHYIYDQEWLAKLGPYFGLVLDRNTPVEQAIQQAFGMSPADFDKGLQQYLNGNRFRYYTLPMPANVEISGYTARPLSIPDSKALLADVHLRSPDYREQAVSEFEEVLKLQPDHPAALRGLGYAYLRKRDYHRAGEYFAKAAQQDSNDAKTLYYSASLAQQEEGSSLKNDAERLAAAQKQLERSIALDPDFPDAYSVLGFVLMTAGKLDQAEPVLQKAIAMNPRNESYSLNLAQLYLMDRKYDESIPLLERLSKSSDSFVSGQAASALAAAHQMKEASAARMKVQSQAGSGPPTTSETEVPVQSDPPKSPSPAKFLKGKLLSVDCSTPPAAILMVLSSAKTWKFHTNNSAHTIVIGADQLSCTWVNQKVAVNYRETGEMTGDVISLEIQ